MEKFLGGSPLAVLARLVILSIVVGIVLAALGLQPFDVINGVKRLFNSLYEMGFDAVEKAFGYLLTGAIIVVPLWFVIRLMSAGRNRNKS